MDTKDGNGDRNTRNNLEKGLVIKIEAIPGNKQTVVVHLPKKPEEPAVYYFLARLGRNHIVEFPILKNRARITAGVVSSDAIYKNIIGKDDPKYVEYDKTLKGSSM